jgi:DNA (cytosine-5)-methyltransferase 1
VSAALATNVSLAQAVVANTVAREFEGHTDTPGVAKLLRNAPLILAGLLVGSLANVELAKHGAAPARRGRA